jgi:alpha-tubulin suppressor-like RCC1 family protein
MVCSPTGPSGGVNRGPPYTATCVTYASGTASAAVACGACCTPNGVDVLCGDAGVGACPGPVAPLVISPTTGSSDTACVLPGVTFTASGGTPPYAWSADVQGLSVSTDTITATWNICDSSVALGTYTITVHDSGTVVQTRTATASVVSTSGPLQVSTSPVAGAGNVPADTLISTTFDRPLAPATVNAAAIDVLADGVAVLGTVSLDAAATTLTFTPAAPLPAGAYVEVWINTSLTDTSGYPVSTRRRWVFGVAAPVVIPLAISPARTVLQGNCQATDRTTFTASGGTPPYTWTTTDPWPGNLAPSTTDPSVSSAVWSPCEAGEGGVIITVTDAVGAKQSADGIVDWPPQLTSTIPAMGDGVQVNTPISATFNKRLDPATVNSASVQVSFGTGPLAGTVALDAAGTTITFTPDAPLPAVQVYQATVFTAVADLLGTPLSNDAWWVFSTVAPGPAVASTSPVDSATWVPYDDPVSVAFSEPVDPATVTSATFYVLDALGAPVAGTVSATTTTASFTPSARLCNPCSFTATVTTAVMSQAGAALTTPRTWSFSTGKAPAQSPSRLAAAGIHTLATKANQSTWDWGTNTAGALGSGGADGAVVLAPVQPVGLPAVQSVDGAAWYSLALAADGTVWGWGWGPNVGLAQSQLLPAPIAGLTGITAISAGYRHGLAVRSDGGVMGWGFEDPYVIDPPIGSYAVRQLPGLADIVAVASGERFSLALRSDGVVLAWGDGTYGQLGNGGTASSATPVRVPGLTGVVAIAAESWTGLALRQGGTLWGWGHNVDGEAGVGSTAATQLVPGPIMGGVAAVATGNYHAVALLSGGTVRSWGLNQFGRLGDGTTTNRNAPVAVAGLSGMAEVSGGEFHSAARGIDGSVWTWGYNGSAQLGDGTTQDRWVPVQVPVLNLNTP